MSDLEAFGRLVIGTDVERAVRDTLQRFTPDYLAWINRERGRQLPTPRSWITSPEFERWPEEQPPSVLIMSSGTTDKPVVEGGGSVRARYDLGVAVVTQAKTEGDAAEIAKLYTAAFVRILTQHRTLGGFANAVEYLGDEWDRMPDRKRKRTLGVGSATFVVEVSDALNVRRGPSEPRVDPTPVYPGDPTIVEASVVIAPEEIPQ